MLDLRTDERRAEVEARLEAEQQKRREAEATVAHVRATVKDWQPIETMPFAAFAEHYGEEATVLVSDGVSVAVASVNERLGRPVKCVKRGEMALTDHGIAYVGSEYEEFDHPQWWFDWEFTDELSTDHEMWGKSEVGFVATHWMPLPEPPK